MSKIPEDVVIAAVGVKTLLRFEPEDRWGSTIARAINAERERGQLKLGQAYQVIADLLVEPTRPDAARVLDYFASDEFDPDFLPWPRQAINEETI